MIEETIHQEDITFINVYAPILGSLKYIMQLLLTDLRREIDVKIIIVGDFNISFTPMDRSSKQKVNRGISVLSDILGQIDLIEIYRIFHPRRIYVLLKCT